MVVDGQAEVCPLLHNAVILRLIQYVDFPEYRIAPVDIVDALQRLGGADLEALLVSGGELPEKYADYSMIFGEMKAMRPSFNKETAHEAVKKELASVCERILLNTAVFKTRKETAQFLIEKAGFIHD